MKTSNRLTTMMVVLAVLLMTGIAHATPATDTIYAQGYMKRANNTAITDGTYTLAFGVFQNGTLLWANTYSVTTSSGLFSQALSGTGGNLAGAALTAAGLAGNFTAVTLNPTLLSGATSGSVAIRVYASTPIDSANPTFDIPLGSVATSYVAGIAKAVEDGSITLTSLAATAAVNTSTGATDAGKIALLNASGVLATTMLPTLSTYGAAASGANTDITSIAPSSAFSVAPAVVTTASGTGNAVTISGGNESGATSTGGSVTIDAGTGTSTNGSISIGGTNSAATLVGGTTVSVAGSTSTTVGSNTGASSTTVQSGTGGTTVSSTGTTASAINMSVSGTNGGITLAPNGTGVVTVSGTTPTVTSAADLTVQAASGSTTTVGPAAGASPITIGGGTGTGAVSIGASTGAQNISIGGGAASAGTIGIGGGSSTGAITIGQSTGAQNVAIGGGAASTGTIAIGGGTSTGAITIGAGAQNTTIGSSTAANSTTIVGGSTGGVIVNTGGSPLTRPVVTCLIASTSATSTAGSCPGVTTAHSCACSLNVANNTATVYPLRYVNTANTITVTWSATTGGTNGRSGCICW